MSEPILVTRALTKKYGGAAAVEGVDLYIEKGQIYGLVGRNGAGKTTIIRMLTAQTVPTSGEIELFGETGEKGISAARARVGAMVEIPSFYPYLTARENLEYYRRQRGIPGEACVDRALEQVGVDERRYDEHVRLDWFYHGAVSADHGLLCLRHYHGYGLFRPV